MIAGPPSHGRALGLGRASSVRPACVDGTQAHPSTVHPTPQPLPSSRAAAAMTRQSRSTQRRRSTAATAQEWPSQDGGSGCGWLVAYPLLCMRPMVARALLG